MTTLSVHVLDAALGVPAAGLAVTLDDTSADTTVLMTDDDGRARAPEQLAAGRHELCFATGAWFGERPHFHPEVRVVFEVEPGREHLHVALLLGPWSYTTYRGS